MITIFIHIPRTAGTTLQAIAREQYNEKGILRLYGADISHPQRKLVRMDNEEYRRLRWITGHIAYGIHAALVDMPQYVTFLRDPIERTLSVYHYIQRAPGHHLHKYARSMTLVEFMESGVTTELDNGMTRQISGICGELPQSALPISQQGSDPEHGVYYWSPETLQTAKANLATFAVVGITERFQESLLQFRDILGWHISDEPMHINALRGRPHAQDVGAKTLEVIERYNRLDQELYEYGLELFEERGE